MISAGDFRNGVTFEEDGNVLQVIEFQHVKPGKGAAFVRTKTKNVITGSVVEKSYNPTAKFPTAYIERKEMTYSYNDEGLYYFMDNDTFEMVPVSQDDLSDNFKFVKENEVCRILSYKGKVFGVEPPTFVTLEVTEKCNLRCKYCIYHPSHPEYRAFGHENMKWDVAKKAIDFLKEHSQNAENRHIGFYGGEPLLNFELIERAVEYAKKLFGEDMSFAITTNATLVNDKIAEYFAKNNFNIIHIFMLLYLINIK